MGNSYITLVRSSRVRKTCKWLVGLGGGGWGGKKEGGAKKGGREGSGKEGGGREGGRGEKDPLIGRI